MRPDCNYYCREDQGISIHAPTQGATEWPTQENTTGEISIHAPTQGATNSSQYLYDAVAISIHAPTQGATTGDLFRIFVAEFQSTHPRRVRRSTLPHFFVLGDFNPRTHAGCDLTQRGKRWAKQKFQSTHPRRVRRYNKDTVRERQTISIHAPTQGATLNSNCRLQAVSISIHAPTQGATASVRLDDRLRSDFNPRTHAGCDRDIRWRHGRRTDFNPRTHAGCDCMQNKRRYSVMI